MILSIPYFTQSFNFSAEQIKNKTNIVDNIDIETKWYYSLQLAL